MSSFASPNGEKVDVKTTLGSIFSDDFGGAAVDTANWLVLNGGLAANQDFGTGTLTQAAIGTGVTGITDSVATSQLTVAMGTTLNAERWYLSKATFGAKEDIIVNLSRSQALAANSVFIGLVEVDPQTLIPLLNPNFVLEFTNRGGAEFGLTTTTTAFQAEAVGDKSSAKATGAVGVAVAALTTMQEYLIEVDSRDVIVQAGTMDSINAKSASPSRVSSQCPNDKKLYKLVMRFKNVGTPGSNTNIVIGRVLVISNYENRVQITGGEGDIIGAKGVPCNVTNTVAVTSASTQLVAGTAIIGSVSLDPLATRGPATTAKLIALGSTNATSVKASQGVLLGGSLHNLSAAVKFVKFYNKASAPTVGTDIPVLTIPLQPNSSIPLGDIVGAYGFRFSTGVAYAITNLVADSDNTAVTAGDVVVNLIYL